MSPLKLEILLTYATSRGDFRGGDFSAPAVREIIEELWRAGVLEEVNTQGLRFAMKIETAAAILSFIHRLEVEPSFTLAVK